MPSFSKVIVVGHLARDPQSRVTNAGTPSCSFVVAVNRRWKTDANEVIEDVSFINCVAFGGRADAIGRYFHKGNPILVEGYFREDRWEDKDTGAKRSALKVIVQTFSFIESRDVRDVRDQAEHHSHEDIPKDDQSDDVPF